jgi:hypothetical protein
MERADGWLRFFFALGDALARDDGADAFLHFAGGFVGERDGENVVGRNAALNHVRDAKSDDARFAGARAGEDEDGTFDGLGGLPLLRVKRTQIHHAGAQFRRSARVRKENRNLGKMLVVFEFFMA